jgi:molecular chaperone DnaK
MPPTEINRLIMIGRLGVTPLLREVLSSELNISVDPFVDPVTGVALGAAVYATSIPLPEEVGFPATRTVGQG